MCSSQGPTVGPCARVADSMCAQAQHSRHAPPRTPAQCAGAYLTSAGFGRLPARRSEGMAGLLRGSDSAGEKASALHANPAALPGRAWAGSQSAPSCAATRQPTRRPSAHSGPARFPCIAFHSHLVASSRNGRARARTGSDQDCGAARHEHGAPVYRPTATRTPPATCAAPLALVAPGAGLQVLASFCDRIFVSPIRARFARNLSNAFERGAWSPRRADGAGPGDTPQHGTHGRRGRAGPGRAARRTRWVSPGRPRPVT